MLVVVVVVMAAANSNSNSNGNSKPKIVTGSAGYVLEDVPHLTDYIPHLPVRPLFSSFIIQLFFFFFFGLGKVNKSSFSAISEISRS